MWIFFFLGGGGGGWGVITKSAFFLGGGGVSFLYILGCLKVKIQNGNFFWAANFQIFLGIPDIPDFFLIFFLFDFFWGGVWVNIRCWVQAYV